MYWSGCQSTGAEMRKYLTVVRLAGRIAGSQDRRIADDGQRQALAAVWVWEWVQVQVQERDVRLSTCCRATMLSGGRLCCASWSRRKVSGATERA